MNFCIITHIRHISKHDKYYGYAPYIREMNIWLRHVDSVTIVAPLAVQEIDEIHEAYSYDNISLKKVPEFDITTFKNIFRALFLVPKIAYVTYLAMAKADHIHLRCPGNMGLIGAIVQIFFPWKTKTAKYAGNWDPNAQQPWTYKLQRWLLSNRFLTKNMQVLVYGEWDNQSKNITPFFTATYHELDAKAPIIQRDFNSAIQFLFVGTLSEGKRPLYAVQFVETLYKKGYDVKLAVLGEGVMRSKISAYCEMNQLNDLVTLYGNKELAFVKEMYQTSHFLILPSKSEGWPKAVAEAMFWGCVPLSTAVSCIPFMLDNGKRGGILKMDINQDIKQIIELMNNTDQYQQISQHATEWSRKYTIDYFEKEIAKLVKQQ